MHGTPDVTLSLPETRALVELRHLVRMDDAVFRLDGPGAMDCLQGILTNDVVRAGPQGLVWGAILTPKGMIITDAWVLRDASSAWVIVPASARTVTAQLFARSFPPRLAKVADCTGDLSVSWLLGGAPTALEGANVARPSGVAPFTALLLSTDRTHDEAKLAEAGWPVAPADFGVAAKLMLGWPTLGREIDEKTLPQEVRFDALGGVRYDKGCYTGQEIVARLHFRGHANRILRGVSWAPGEGPADDAVMLGEKRVGALRTIGRLGDRVIALATIRHEVDLGSNVIAGGADAVVVEPPFDLAEFLVA